ncbi:hypothetical protein BELL_0060g00220 [Botrytis elliptica]|uniref:Uncharacterized protein n=1 Tax=Botrytis elliptica TaxID=278938 RepID=A0A4Z1JYN3_9HELO|nr:hypothetical protein EAE99_001285 [Botrytis elliptica]TGO78628.1 hypothetical protein BELL_0060g00220 [Botrytis elliptica]
MRLHRVFLFAFIGNAIAVAIVERAKETDCSLSPSLCSTKKTSSTTSSSTTSSTTSSSTTSSTTSSSSTIQTTGTLTADFSASATAATATCGAGFLPETATDRARSILQTNTTSTCATISPGWPCFGIGMTPNQDTVSAIRGAFDAPDYHGTVAFLCNLSEVPMTTAGFDVAVLDDLIYVKHCANYTPAALMSPGEWVYGYLDWNTVQTVGQSSELCTHVMSQVVAYPNRMS